MDFIIITVVVIRSLRCFSAQNFPSTVEAIILEIKIMLWCVLRVKLYVHHKNVMSRNWYNYEAAVLMEKIKDLSHFFSPRPSKAYKDVLGRDKNNKCYIHDIITTTTYNFW